MSAQQVVILDTYDGIYLMGFGTLADNLVKISFKPLMVSPLTSDGHWLYCWGLGSPPSRMNPARPTKCAIEPTRKKDGSDS